MRENRTCGSEGGEAQSLPYPYLGIIQQSTIAATCSNYSGSLLLLVGWMVLAICALARLIMNPALLSSAVVGRVSLGGSQARLLPSTTRRAVRPRGHLLKGRVLLPIYYLQLGSVPWERVASRPPCKE